MGFFFRKKNLTESSLGGGAGGWELDLAVNVRMKGGFTMWNLLFQSKISCLGFALFLNSLVCYLARRLLELAGAISLILASRSVYESTEKLGASFNQYFLNCKFLKLSVERVILYYSKKSQSKKSVLISIFTYRR